MKDIRVRDFESAAWYRNAPHSRYARAAPCRAKKKEHSVQNKWNWNDDWCQPRRFIRFHRSSWGIPIWILIWFWLSFWFPPLPLVWTFARTVLGLLSFFYYHRLWNNFCFPLFFCFVSMTIRNGRDKVAPSNIYRHSLTKMVGSSAIAPWTFLGVFWKIFCHPLKKKLKKKKKKRKTQPVESSQCQSANIVPVSRLSFTPADTSGDCFTIICLFCVNLFTRCAKRSRAISSSVSLTFELQKKRIRVSLIGSTNDHVFTQSVSSS